MHFCQDFPVAHVKEEEDGALVFGYILNVVQVCEGEDILDVSMWSSTGIE